MNNTTTQHEERGITEENLKGLVLLFKKSRGVNKEKHFKDFCGCFMQFQKQKGLLAFPKEHIRYLFLDVFSLDKIKKNTQKTLNFLLNEKKIKEHYFYKTYYYYVKKNLCCFDSGSYAIMMKYNGYKKYLYKEEYDAENQHPTKTLKGVCRMNEKINPEIDFNMVETKSHKKREFQGVKNNGAFSVKREGRITIQKTYLIL